MAKKTQPKGGTKMTKEFLIPLTDEESNQKGKAAAALRKEVQDLKLQFEEVKDSWNAKIKTREAKRDELLDLVHAQKEKRVLEVMLVKNFEEKKVEFWHEGKLLEERTMTASEVQMDMDDVNKKTRAIRQKLEKDKDEPAKPDPIAAAHAGNGKFEDVGEVHNLETRRATKTSAVDGPVKQ